MKTKQYEQQEMSKTSNNRKRTYSNNSDLSRRSDDDNDVDYESILNNHSCTDILCSIIFLIFIILLVFVSIFAYLNGNPSDLVLPHDSDGRICGKRTENYNNEKKNYLLFFDITKCFSLTSAITGCSTKQICVTECPNTYAYNKISSQVDYINQYCDPNNKADCPKYLLASKPVFGRCLPELISDVIDDSSKIIKVFDKENNRSIPIEVPSFNGTSDLTLGKLRESINYIRNILDLKKIFELAYEDLSKSYIVILIALLLGAFLSFLWIVILKFIVKPTIYLTILIVLAALGYGTYFSINTYIELKNNSTTNDLKFQFEKIYDIQYMSSLTSTWLVLGITLGILFLVFFLVILFLIKRINLASELIKEVSKAIVSIPLTLIWPVLPLIIELCIIFYCASVALYLASAGIQLFKVIDTNSTRLNISNTSNLIELESSFKYIGEYKVGDFCEPSVFYEMKNRTGSSIPLTFECYYFDYGFNTTIPIDIDSKPITNYYSKAMEFINKYQWIPQFYVLFMFFWLTAFVIGLNEMTLAGSFGAWYWTRFKNIDKQYKNKLPLFTVFGSLGRSIFYHLGTIAFGSLLIAIIKLIRAILEYLESKLKQKKEVSKVARYAFTCCKCCFWCLEKFIKFINRYAFIITSVYSFNFCKAASKAFKLITTNVVRVVVIDKITNFILNLSNIAITSLIGVASFFFFTKKIPLDFMIKLTPDLNYYFVPLILIILGVYTITKLFFDVFAMGVDTMLICVLIDCDQNDGTKAKPYFMSKNLKKILKVSNKHIDSDNRI